MKPVNILNQPVGRSRPATNTSRWLTLRRIKYFTDFCVMEGERFITRPQNPICMKPKSNAAIIKSMKASKKKGNYRQAATAIERKLVEIITDNRKTTASHTNLAIFRYML